MLEGEHQPPARLVIAQRRAGAAKGRPLAGAGGAKRLRHGREIERPPAAGATRIAEKSDAAPAGNAKRPRRRDRSIAIEAARRQQHIKRRPADPAKGAAKRGRRDERAHAQMLNRRVGGVNDERGSGSGLV